jgi:hypothetical protein
LTFLSTFISNVARTEGLILLAKCWLWVRILHLKMALGTRYMQAGTHSPGWYLHHVHQAQAVCQP